MAPLALVTGASSGIGQAFAERLAADGYDLIVVGRRRDRLEALAARLPQVAVEIAAEDLSTDEGIDSVAGLCADRPLTMLVNNAGVAHYMPLADLPAAPGVDDDSLLQAVFDADLAAFHGQSPRLATRYTK